jgi:hypothetical protein
MTNKESRVRNERKSISRMLMYKCLCWRSHKKFRGKWRAERTYSEELVRFASEHYRGLNVRRVYVSGKETGRRTPINQRTQSLTGRSPSICFVTRQCSPSFKNEKHIRSTHRLLIFQKLLAWNILLAKQCVKKSRTRNLNFYNMQFLNWFETKLDPNIQKSFYCKFNFFCHREKIVEHAQYLCQIKITTKSPALCLENHFDIFDPTLTYEPNPQITKSESERLRV